ncbi:carbohydrate-binding module family 14 protein [Streptomyces sp. NPDC093589]|uniref:carbohydrate-binding module family 14 protein n=1 Tax=Streptomyces sp. NPDC093589 TaxID=3366043 RepID=UPI00382BDB32
MSMRRVHVLLGVLAAVGLLSAAAPSQASPHPAGFSCPAADGTFNHQDLNKFWHCSNGIAHEKQCAAANPPLVFQEDPRGAPHEGRCVWPWESDRELSAR